MLDLSFILIMNRAPNIFTLDYHILNRLVVMLYTTKCDKTFLAFSPEKLTIQGIFRTTVLVIGRKQIFKGAAMEFFYLLS